MLLVLVLVRIIGLNLAYLPTYYVLYDRYDN